MNINIRIDYSMNRNTSYRQGSFPLGGKTPEEVAYQWWRQIKKEHSYWVELEKVVVNAEQDITDKIKAIENALISDI
ncbi:MAG: hypothetical protein Q8934_14345 [Bacillota bacterium]|nr:hypothetical protein [Bacillota bacterium]